MRHLRPAVWLVLILGSIALADDAALLPVTAPPAELVARLGLDPFYKKCLLDKGFPIVASEAVHDAALREAAYLIDHELDGRDDLRQALIDARVRFVIIGVNEYTTTIPEYSHMTPAPYWDRRARGLGATPSNPIVTCGEENLLCLKGDPYGTENILIHEFGHAIHEVALAKVDPTFDRRLEETYEHAMKTGLWAGKYASTNRQEYWAEGVQSWFDTNRVNDHDHNYVHLRDQLKEYDPQLAALIEKELGDGAWRYQRPEDRPAEERAHLAGFDAASAPRFAWPEALKEWDWRHAAGKMAEDNDYKELPRDPVPADAALPHSTGGGKATQLLFVNLSDHDIHFYWLDWKGQRTMEHRLRPKVFDVIDTFADHAWLITDADDQPLYIVRGADTPGKCVIR
ncbi:MAG: hypothetical protein GC162_04695 [Planctomycetes bacterium]|nr:hypothetical protein [Planctomycetota bacterium]